MSDADVEVVREVYAAMAARDITRLLELIDADFVVTQDPRSHGAVATSDTRGSPTSPGADVGDRLQRDHRRHVQRRRRCHPVRPDTRCDPGTGTAFDIAEVHRWTIRDGKAVAAHFSIDTPAMRRALEGDATP